MMMYRNVFENRHGSPYSASCNRYSTVTLAKEQQRGRDDFAWMERSYDGGKTWQEVKEESSPNAVDRPVSPAPELGASYAAPDLYRELARELVKNEELRLAGDNLKQAQDAFIAQSTRLLAAEQRIERLAKTMKYLKDHASDESDRKAAAQALAGTPAITTDECFAKCSDYSCVRMGTCTAL